MAGPLDPRGPSGEQRIEAAFTDIRRADFLPRRLRSQAGLDRPVPIGHAQTNSQPTTVRTMLALLDVGPGDRVLDVGSGSGWTTALLAHLVGPAGLVLGVELVPTLAEAAQRRLDALALTWANVRTAEPGVLGIPAEAPYHRILVSAEARAIPQPLVDQLARNGRMVIPVAGRMAVVDRNTQGAVTSRLSGYYAFVPLIWQP